MTQLLESTPDIDCVFAVNDVMAVGAMAACRDHGLKLPRDLALAGFDDIATLRDLTPGLSTVRLPLEQVGALALEMVVTADGPAPGRSGSRARSSSGPAPPTAADPQNPRDHAQSRNATAPKAATLCMITVEVRGWGDQVRSASQASWAVQWWDWPPSWSL